MKDFAHLVSPPQNIADAKNVHVAVSVCYHCGETLSVNDDWRTQLQGEWRRFCCGGCQAIAQVIHGAGFSQFYTKRADYENVSLESKVERESNAKEDWSVYDDPKLQAQYLRRRKDGTAETSLILENIRCSACIWLNQQYLLRLPGVQSVQISYATHRAHVCWNPQRVQLSEILNAVACIGYRAYPFEAGRAADNIKKEQRALLTRMLVAFFAMMQVMMYTWPMYTHPQSVAIDHVILMHWASLLLTLPVVLYSAWSILVGAWRSLKNWHLIKKLSMDVPVAIGIVAAFIASAWSTWNMAGEVYFDSITMFVGFLLFARYLELRARQISSSSVELMVSQIPASCTVLDSLDKRQPKILAVVRLQEGDLVLVKPGEVIPADGMIVDGASKVEEALLTGESFPVSKRQGDIVLAGGHNCSSPLIMSVLQTGEKTRLAEIERLLERALFERPRIAELTDKVASWFVVSILLLAMLAGLCWWVIEPVRVLPIMISILVVSCPCALSLATPMALAIASRVLAQKGVLLTRGHVLESLIKVSDVVFDKTGTLTQGEFSVQKVHSSLSDKEIFAIARALEVSNNHPIAKAILRYAKKWDDNTLVALNVNVFTGEGVEGYVNQGHYRIGNQRFVRELFASEETLNMPIETHYSSQTHIFLANSNGLLAIIDLSDKLRAGSPELVQNLQQMGKQVHILSGDTQNNVDDWNQTLCADFALGGVSPEKKREYVQNLQQKGKVVLMLGDGINDAPVLGQAQVSVAMGSGASLAHVGADAVLVSSDIALIQTVLPYAFKVHQTIRHTLSWAFAYNIIAIPIAVLGLVSPWMAGLGMVLSSIYVTVYTFRLRQF